MQLRNISNIYLLSSSDKTELAKAFNGFHGMNAPDHLLNQSGAEHPISKYLPKIDGKYFVVGSLENDIETTNHGLSHAMLYLNEDYRDAVENIIAPHYYMLRSLKSNLLKKGTLPSNMLEEINATLISGKEYLVENDLWNIEISHLSNKLSKLFYNSLSKYSNLSRMLMIA